MMNSTASTTSLTEWVEIIEPKSQEHMFANLTTGECVWDPPKGVAIKKANQNQWWELFDQNTSRFYYYNASSQRNVWHRPANCDIIPLAKLQTLKQNTEVQRGPDSDADADVSDDRESSGKEGGKVKRKFSFDTSSSLKKKSKGCSTDERDVGGSGRLSRLLPSKNVRLTAISQVQTSPVPSPKAAKKARHHFHQHKMHPLEQQRPQAAPRLRPSGRETPQQISRSVSFMGRQNPKDVPDYTYDKFFGATGWKAATPAAATSEEPRMTSPQVNGGGVDGYCTPMQNRKNIHSPPSSSSITRDSPVRRSAISLGPRPQPQPKPRLSLRKKSFPDPPSSSLYNSDNLSISDLVDSGSILIDDCDVPLRPKPVKMLNGAGSRDVAFETYMREMKGYYGDDTTGESNLESEDDGSQGGRQEDCDGDDEESDDVSKASSFEGDEEDEEDTEGAYLSCHSEPTYHNDPRTVQSLERYTNHAAAKLHSVPPPVPPHQYPPAPPPRPHPRSSNSSLPPFPNDVDAFSQAFESRLRLGSASSTMPRSTPGLPPPPTAGAEMQDPNYPVPYEILHASLQRKAHSMVVTDHSAAPFHQGSSRMSLDPGRRNVLYLQRNNNKQPPSSSCQSDFQRYAEDNLNVQKKGLLFKRRIKLKDVLSWSGKPVATSLTRIRDKTLKKQAVDIFKLVQMYMGDRKANQRLTVDSVAMDIIDRGFRHPDLRDEIFVQLCKQTWDNPKIESLRRGWELLAICLGFFPPTAAYSPCLFSYISLHTDPKIGNFPDSVKGPIRINEYAQVCAKRLRRIGETGRIGPRKPTSDEIKQSRTHILRPSLFGCTLAEVMDLQTRTRYSTFRLPWILTALSAQVMELNGTKTEGIFRVPADQEEVNALKSRFDNWENIACSDCHTAASLMKLWLRELYEPLVPDRFYEDAVETGAKAEEVTAAGGGGDDYSAGHCQEMLDSFVSRLPDINRLTLSYLVHYLQRFAREDVVRVTKMDAANLATVFAPNFLRCPYHDPVIIMENTRKEMTFVKNLILFMDTSFVVAVY